MVGDDDSRNACRYASLCIFMREDAFDDDGQLGDFNEIAHRVPGRCRIAPRRINSGSLGVLSVRQIPPRIAFRQSDLAPRALEVIADVAIAM